MTGYGVAIKKIDFIFEIIHVDEIVELLPIICKL